MNIFIAIEIKNPNVPKMKTPIAETFAMVSNSFLEGFFNTDQTLLHLIVNDFNFVSISLIKLIDLKIY